MNAIDDLCIAYDKLEKELVKPKPTSGLLSCFTYEMAMQGSGAKPLVVDSDAETACRALGEIIKNPGLRDNFSADFKRKYMSRANLEKGRVLVETAQHYLRMLVLGEIEELISKQNHDARMDRIDEIHQEVVSYDARFEDFSGFRAATHPKTYRVMQVMTLVGWHIVLYFKIRFRRSRPSALSAELIPEIDVPTHPSYPSGHATQSYLVALALEKVFASRDFFPAKEMRPYSEGLRELAKQIGVNREWAGVHYDSDSATGRELAKSLRQLWLDNERRYPLINRLIAEARSEWYENEDKTSPGP